MAGIYCHIPGICGPLFNFQATLVSLDPGSKPRGINSSCLRHRLEAAPGSCNL